MIDWVSNLLAFSLGVTCIIACVLGITMFIVWRLDIKWDRKGYLWEYIDKKYDIILVEREGNDEKE